MNLRNIESIQKTLQRIGEISQKIQSPPVPFAPRSNFKQELDHRIEEVSSQKASLESNKPESVKAPLKKPALLHDVSTKIQKKANISQKLDLFIHEQAKNKGVDPALVKAVIKAESNFNPKAVSHAGARGMMQLMPATAKILGVKNSMDPFDNIKGGTSYLRDMLKTFKDKDKALAAYNAGPGAVRKYKGIPPYSETRNYVKKVNQYYQDYKAK